MQDVKTPLSLTTPVSSNDALTKSISAAENIKKSKEDQGVRDSSTEFGQLLGKAEQELHSTSRPDRQTRLAFDELNSDGKNLQPGGKELPLNGVLQPVLSEEAAAMGKQSVSDPGITKFESGIIDAGQQESALQSIFEPGSENAKVSHSENPAIKLEQNLSYSEDKIYINHNLIEKTSSYNSYGQSLFGLAVSQADSIHQNIQPMGFSEIQRKNISERPLVTAGYESTDLSMEPVSESPTEFLNGFSNETKQARDIAFVDTKAVLNPAVLKSGAESLEADLDLARLNAVPLISNNETKLSLFQNSGQTSPVARLDTAFGQPGWANEFILRVNGLAVSAAGEHTARIQLRPAELGAVEIRLATEADNARVHFVVQTQAAREAIESALPRLRDSFEQVGLSLDSTDVSSQNPQPEGTDRDSRNSNFGYVAVSAEQAELTQGSEMTEHLSTDRPMPERSGQSVAVDLYI